ncbi:MAG: carbohydrate-binding family 9-like protein [Verrucomicrobiales bacterium]|nr:carbohydrate-binding family 9-like protein [Verrucomicrobiales bacterium]
MTLAISQANELPRGVAWFTDQPLTVDGVLDEPAWQRAPVLRFSAASAEDGETRMLWSAEGLYVTFSAVERTPVLGYAKAGEPVYREDAFELFVDQAGDHRQYYEVQVSASGQVFVKCYVLTEAPRLNAEGWLTRDFIDRCLWRYDVPAPESLRVASRLDAQSGRWTLELFVPAELVNRRFGGALQPRAWRVNITRHDWDLPPAVAQRRGRFLYWAPVYAGHPHLSPTLMGYLELSYENAKLQKPKSN